MHFFGLILLLCFFIFLFCLYALSYDDLVFLRKDVSMTTIFNVSFIGALVSLLFARIFYGLLYAQSIFANPLKFLLFPYFPGLLLSGALIGAVGFLWVLRRKKMPLLRLSDFFSISFLSALPVGYLGYFLLSKIKIFSFLPLFLILIYLLLFILFMTFLLPCLHKGKIKDGSITFLFLVIFSAVSLIKNFIDKKAIFLSIEDFILLLILLISAVFLIDKENLIEKIKKSRK